MANTVRLDAAMLGAIVGFFFGELDGLLLALLGLIALDYCTGILVAITQKKLSSSVGFTGIARKGVILAVVAVGHIVDVHVLGGSGAVFRSAVIGFYLANEGMSILENAGKLGMPLPRKLTEVLRQLKSDSENKEEE